MRPLCAIDWANAEPADRRGHRLPETVASIETRNRLLIEVARHFTGSDREIARQLHYRLSAYRGGRWRRSRTDAVCPHEPGSLAASLWAVLKARDYLVSERVIRRAIRGPRVGM